MSINDIRRLFVPLALVAMVAACGGADDAAADGREIELTPSAADEPLNDAARTTTPSPAPANRSPAATTPRTSAASTGVVAAGTSFAVNNTARICTNTHKAGDRFTTTVASDVIGTNGTKIPAGATVTLAVTESAISKNSRDNWKLAFSVVSVTIGGETLNVTGDVTQVATIQAVRSQSTGQQAGKVATGAAIGAVAGQILGKDTKSTVVGAAAGAVAGGAVAAATTDYEGCLPEGGRITIALGAPLTIKRTG
jgi:hypothetical protein